MARSQTPQTKRLVGAATRDKSELFRIWYENYTKTYAEGGEYISETETLHVAYKRLEELEEKQS